MLQIKLTNYVITFITFIINILFIENAACKNIYFYYPILYYNNQIL